MLIGTRCSIRPRLNKPRPPALPPVAAAALQGGPCPAVVTLMSCPKHPPGLSLRCYQDQAVPLSRSTCNFQMNKAALKRLSKLHLNQALLRNRTLALSPRCGWNWSRRLRCRSADGGGASSTTGPCPEHETNGGKCPPPEYRPPKLRRIPSKLTDHNDWKITTTRLSKLTECVHTGYPRAKLNRVV